MGKKADQSFDNKVNKLGNDALKIKAKAKGNKMNTKKIVITTIVSTLLVLAAFAGTFYAGTRYEADRHSVIRAEAVKIVDELKSQSK